MSIDMTSKDAERDDLGTDAATPQQIPMRGWLQVTRRAWEESKSDQVPLLAAGVAFFSFLSLFPAMIAAVMVYGLARDPDEVSAQTQELADTLPDDAASLLTTQMEKIAATPRGSLGLGLMVSLVLALWAASGGVGNIITSINLAYSEDETRGLVKRKALALGLTAGAIVFVLLAVALVAVAPPLLDSMVGSGPLRWALEVIRWTLLLVAMSVMLAVLYRIAPDRRAPKFRWVSVGALVATVIWLLASFGFSIYVENFGSYGETYGTLAGVVVLLLWLWITMFVVLFGAEINAESEHQTTADTTVGENQPIGKREAVKADTVANQ
jgi:membrane protein